MGEIFRLVLKFFERANFKVSTEVHKYSFEMKQLEMRQRFLWLSLVETVSYLNVSVSSKDHNLKVRTCQKVERLKCVNFFRDCNSPSSEKYLIVCCERQECNDELITTNITHLLEARHNYLIPSIKLLVYHAEDTTV